MQGMQVVKELKL